MKKSDQSDRVSQETDTARSDQHASLQPTSAANRNPDDSSAAVALEDSALAHTADLGNPGRAVSPTDGQRQLSNASAHGQSLRSTDSYLGYESSSDGETADLGPIGLPGSLHGASTGPSARRSAVPTPVTFPVTDWERYEFLGLLGQGGMGAVYKARDRRLKRVVALKFIRGDDSKLIKRFLQEARAQARIEHPGICKVLEVGEVQGKSYIAMQLVEGQSLQQAKSELSVLDKVQVIKDAALALHAAHELGIIHRDVKPANIMVTRSDAGSLQPVVMDFGLARDANDESSGMTESGAIMGTAAFMSPEQARGDVKRLDRRTDVYSLGATLYDLLTGRPPFAASSMADTLLKVIMDDALPLRTVSPNLPDELDVIVGKCLNKEPEQRYQTARELADDLARFLGSERIIGKRLGLIQRLRWRAKSNPRMAVAVFALIVSVLGFFGQGVYSYVQNLRKEREAKQQAELARRLGQEITVMEWLLRTARGMPTHDLNREKRIVHQRMLSLQTEFSKLGAAGRALAHYALGRGHLGLHEYPEALTELQESIDLGFRQGEAYYALGVALGKLYEQAMYEARLAGGGAWAQKRLREIEPKYLRPAIAALTMARSAKTDSPEYLEALIAYYQRDYATALHKASAALSHAPWLYEAMKLHGDVHLEEALDARDHGKYDAAETAFAAAVKSYSDAAAVGESDGEVFEGLAEVWVRRIEMDVDRGQPIGSAYDAAIGAGDRYTMVEPQSIVGHLKNAFAAEKTMSLVGGGKSSAERVSRCLSEADAVLKQRPEHPYAREMAALCHLFEAELAQGRGEDPEPILTKALMLLEPAVAQHPQFLWGINDLATAYAVFGIHLQSKGSDQARPSFERALEYAERAMALDETYLIPIQNALFVWARLIAMAKSDADLQRMLVRADDLYAKCMKINNKHQQCNINYLMVYARAAQRKWAAGLETQQLLSRAFALHAQIEKLGGTFLDADQHVALAYYVDAEATLKRGHDPNASIEKAESALTHCLAQAGTDAMCRTLSAQVDWVKAEQRTSAKERMSVLQAAKRKAEEATQSPDQTPDAWQVLASTCARLAAVDGLPTNERNRQIAAGLIAVNKALSIHPLHPDTWVAQGDLLYLRSQSNESTEVKKSAFDQAVQSHAKAVALDPLLERVVRLKKPGN